MKKTSFLMLSVFICFFMLSGKKTTILSETDLVSKKVAILYAANFHRFQREVNVLDSLANKSTLVGELEKLKKQVEKTRLVYKRIEFIFDYYQTPYNGTYINGAPLPKISEYFENGKVIQPCGLQALDEIVFKETVSKKDLKDIELLANELKKHVDFVAKTYLPVQLKPSKIIEAMRSGMVRIFTLGISGYDTPGSGNGLKESYESLKSIKKAFLCFSIGIQPEANIKFQTINTLFSKGEKLLNANICFNDFDRLQFLKEIVNPLYAELLEFQDLNLTKLEPYKKHAQNYKVKNIFDANFINSDFYSELVTV